MNLKQTLKRAAVAVVPLGLAAPAFASTAATTFDPTSYVSSVTGTIAGILLIGGAVFGVYVALKSTKWARRSL